MGLSLWKRCFSFIFVMVSFFVLIACDPIPTRTLNRKEKATDILWVFNLFDTDYAPLEYKINSGVLDLKGRGLTQDWKGYENLKKRYLARAQKTKNNQDFIELVQEFVSEFKDAHTSVSFKASNSFDNVKISYLGITGLRVGDGFLVTGIHPGLAHYYGREFPVRPGDIITHLNGNSLKEIILTELVKYRNLGNELSNLTYHMNGVFNRYSLSNGTIADKEALITVQSATNQGEPVIKDVKLHWITKSLREYRLERQLVEQASSEPIKQLVVKDAFNKSEPIAIEFVDFNGKPIVLNPERIAKKYAKGKSLRFLEDFQLLPDPFTSRWVARSALLSDSQNAEQAPSAVGLAKLREERIIPSKIIGIEEAKTFPAYVRSLDVKLPNGQTTKKFVGYLRIDTFSPEQNEAVVLNEVKTTLQKFQDFGVENIVIDLLNNGGGSVSLVYKLVYLLTNTHIQDHSIQLGVNETWIQNTKRGNDLAPVDPEKDIQTEMHEGLLKDRDAGRRLTQEAYPINRLVNYLDPNWNLKKKFNIVLLINEMCASAADIFPSMMKENGLAVLIGENTMGAGGNVHQNLANQSPNLHAKINFTHSLIQNTEKNYIESIGVAPHIKVDTSLFAPGAYSMLIDMAQTLVLNQTKMNQLLGKTVATKLALASTTNPLSETCEEKLAPKKIAASASVRWKPEFKL